MSKNNKTTQQVILRYKEGSSSADRSKVEPAGAKFFDQGGFLCASLCIAWPRKLKFNFPDGSHLIFSRPKSKNPVLTKRQIEIVHELLMPMFLEFCESIANTEADREKIKKNKEQYEKVIFGKLRNDQEKANRAGAEFVRSLQLAELYHRDNPVGSVDRTEAPSIVARIRTVFGTPLFQALVENNTQFMQGILEQMRHSLSKRQQIKKRLIEIDELRHPTRQTLTWKDIWQKYCPDYIDTPENFQHLLKECGIPFAPAGVFRRQHVRKHEKNTC